MTAGIPVEELARARIIGVLGSLPLGRPCLWWSAHEEHFLARMLVRVVANENNLGASKDFS